MRLPLVAGLAVMILPAAVPARHQSLPVPVLPDGLGVNIHFTDPRPGEMEMLAAAFRWVRMDLIWEATEREKGVYDFSAYDRLAAALDRHGVRALFILDYGNRLYDGGLAPHTEEGRRAFARWAAAAARRFAGRGILWEMWNEPNIGFWKPEPKVEDYVKLAAATGAAMAEAAPGEAYIGPATSQVDLAFLEECFKAGLLDYWSAVSVHPYRQTAPETAAADYRSLRRLIDRYAPEGKSIPILSGEWGYSVGWAGMSGEKQGRMLCRQWLFNVAGGVPLSIWYDWHDDGEDPKEPEHHFGTVRFPYRGGGSPVYEPKPSYRAAKALQEWLSGFTFGKRLAVGAPEDWVLLFVRGKEQKLAAWTTARRPRAVVIPARPGSFRVVSHEGEPLPAVVAGPGGLALTLDGAPRYLEPENSDGVLGAAAAREETLEVDLLPAGEVLPIRMRNLSTAPFSGRLTLTGLKGLRCAKPLVDVALAGDAETILRIPAVVTGAGAYTAGARIEDGSGRLILESPARTFVLLRDFSTGAWNVLPDGDANVSSEQALKAEAPPDGPPLAGMPVLRLEYRFARGWKFVRVAPEAGLAIEGEPEAAGLWIYGDGNGNLARLRFTDATGQTFQPNGTAVDWKGWRYVLFPMDGRDCGHWGGGNDGVVRYPLRWDCVFLLDSARQQETRGAVFISAPVLIH